MKKFFQFCIGGCLLIIMSWQVIAATEPLLVLDSKNIWAFPESFRTTSKPLLATVKLSLLGLKDLHALGSAQFSELQLQKVKQFIGTSFTIVDLRQESHGFLNGNAISWYGDFDWANLGKTNQEVDQDQQRRLTALKNQSHVIVSVILHKSIEGAINKTQLLNMPIQTVFSEQELAQHLNLGYQRFYVTDRRAPIPSEVDRFVVFMKNLPKDQWVYFHCREGKGRTTTFMSMADMMRNAKSVSLDDIVNRQAALGGIDLLREHSKKGLGKKFVDQRIIFIKTFYAYCVQNNDNFATSFSNWMNAQKRNAKTANNTSPVPSTIVPVRKYRVTTGLA